MMMSDNHLLPSLRNSFSYDTSLSATVNETICVESEVFMLSALQGHGPE